MSNHPPFLDNLSEVQRAAAMYTEGPEMIIAGAGSGKTRVITFRIAYLLHKGVDAFNILSLTFTNKAAKEMKERIERVVGTEARNLWMGTFHSIFARILRFDGHLLGYPSNFTIYDIDDSKSLIRAIIKEKNLNDKQYKVNMILSRISMAKNNLMNAAMYANNSNLVSYDDEKGVKEIAAIFKIYEDRCYKAGAMDFDDLLVNTEKLLGKFPEALYKYQHKFKYIMVDEYQDTNHCQYMIVKRLAAMFENICIVGDDAQSIYSFRGATIQNILNFKKDYPDVKIFKLEQNYRSTQNIVDAASAVIKKNTNQLEKNIFSKNNKGDKIKIVRHLTDNEEGRYVAQTIFDEKMQHQKMNSDFAVLYRTNAQSRSIEEGLRKLNIPYKIYGGISFYQRKEIKDMLCYLRFMINDKDEAAFKRIINYPKRGIGKTSIDKIVLLAAQENKTLWEIASNVDKYPILKGAASKIGNFVLTIKSFKTMLADKNAYEIANYVAQQTGIISEMYTDKTVEGIAKYENVQELLNGIKEFTEDDTNEQEKTLDIYLQDVALITTVDISDKKNEDDNNKVLLMTIHMSKGLEFDHTFIVGLEEGLFPSQMSMHSREDFEEERRLFYVAMTRACNKLDITYANTRFKFGKLQHTEPSRFLSELDEEYVEWINNKANPKLETAIRGNFARDNYTTNKTNVKTKKNTFSSRPAIKKSTFKPDPNFIPSPVDEIKEGLNIVHQRFGEGIIEKIDGVGTNRKATVKFHDEGVKTLILRFAKLKIK